MNKNILKKGLFFLGIIAIVFFLFFQKDVEEQKGYADTYNLVNEKISQSAGIKIYLPKGIDIENAKERIVFEPEIKGAWVDKKASFLSVFASEDDYVLEYKPDEKLDLNKSYSVMLNLDDDKVMQAYFLCVEDPEIINIIPLDGSEAAPDSKITIIFNRPIVSLTTLEELEKKDVPVSIYPETKGKFKWISTSTLQFIPEKELLRSTNYKVKVNAGFVSADGLPVKGKDIGFVSYKLRYLQTPSLVKNVLYNEPLRLYFNQPVDLNKTIKEISLFKEGKKIEFTARYKGESEEKGFFSSLFDVSKKNEEIDKSVIEIYNKKDRFNRKEIWDFEEDYNLEVQKVYPLEGDITIEDVYAVNFKTTSIVKSFSAKSPRTENVSIDLFDPNGELIVDFYEDVNLSKSRINANYSIKNMKYGEKCKEDWQSLSDSNCERVEDREKVVIEFKESELKAGDVVKVVLKEIVNEEGFKINAEEIQQEVNVFKPLKVEAEISNLQTIVLNSNNPLVQLEKEELEKMIKANLDFEVFSLSKSYFTDDELPFRTYVYVGLQPEKDYEIEFNLKDVFNNEESFILKSRTGAMEYILTNAFSLQQNYSVTPPSKTKLTFGTKNILYVDVSVCKMSETVFVDNLNRNRNDRFNLNVCSEVKKKRIEFPERYWLDNYFTIDIGDFYEEKIGNYAIRMDHPLLREYTPITFLTVTNLSASEKRITPNAYLTPKMTEEQLKSLQNIYFVSDMITGDAVSNADVYYYYESGEYKKQGSTNKEGVLLANPVFGLKAVIVKNGKDNTILQGSQSQLNYASTAYNVKKFYLYQDRPIYRPLDEVNIKGILRLGYDLDYEIFYDKVELIVRNSKRDEILKEEFELDKFGTINTKFILPEDAPLGNYSVCVMEMCSYFDVQEYIPSAFEVNLSTDKEEYISKENVKINVDANYYFGVPIEYGEVSYTISSQNYFFDKFKDGYFAFGAFDYMLPEDKFILRGETILDAQGKGIIEEVLDLGTLNSQIIVLDVSVKNAMGQSVSSQKSFILHQGEFYLGVSVEPFFAGKNQEISLKIKSVDIEGNSESIKKLKAEVYKVSWVHAKRQELDGTLLYKWEKKRELVLDFEFDTDTKGDYLKKIKLEEQGIYEIDVFSKDKKGNKVLSRTDVYIFGEGYVSLRYTDETDLNLTTKQSNLNVSDIGEIVIESPFEKAKALIAIERGSVFRYEIIDIDQSLYNYKFEILEDYYPNVFVSVLLQSKGDPFVKYGNIEFKVNSDLQKLEIEFKSDKDFYKPGEQVKLEVLTKDFKGEPVSSSVSVAVVDLSVLALKGNPKKDPLIFFYNGFPLAVSTFSNLKSIKEIKELERTKGGGGGDIDGEKARGEFKDTAFFEANIVTDKNGRAEVVFKIPDNLTTWQAEALGVSEDTKLGVDYITFMTKKDLMLVPLKPRFIIPGDEFYIGAQVFNQSDKNDNFKITFESETLEILDKKEVSLNISKKSSERVYFKVKAPDTIDKGFHSFEMFAKSKELSDGVVQVIKINDNLTYEVTATQGYTLNDKAFETIYIPENVSQTKGELNIKSSATLAVFLSDALNYLIQYPYGCAEQIASRLKAIAIIKSGLEIPNLEEKFNLKKIVFKDKEYTLDEAMQIGLSQLYTYQNYDGGFSFWGNSFYSNYYVTLFVVDALTYAKSAGYAVNENALNKGADYLYKEWNNKYALYPSDTIMLAKVLLNVYKHKNNAILQAKIEEIIKDEVLLKDKLSNKFLAELAVIVNAGDFDLEIKKRVNNLLDNRIKIDARGAFLDISKDNAYNYFETAISNTAAYLNALVLGKRDSSFNERVLRWILNSRDKEGAFYSTQNTLQVIEAFTNYLKWKEETDVNYNLSIDLNNTEIESFDFNKNTILDQVNKTLKIDELKKGDFNFLEFSKDNKGSLYYDASLKYYITGGDIAPRDEGFTIMRGFYNLEDVKNEEPLSFASAGDVFKVHIEVIVPQTRRFVAIEDYIPAGLEIVNLDLATEDKSLILTEKEVLNRSLYPDFKEIRDDRYFVYKDILSPGIYEFDYYARALVKGEFLQLPCIVSEMYTPENFGRTASNYFVVK